MKSNRLSLRCAVWLAHSWSSALLAGPLPEPAGVKSISRSLAPRLSSNDLRIAHLTDLMKATRIYADAKGTSHFADLEVPLKSSGEIGCLSEPQPGAGVVFRETEPSYDYDWHQPPRKQWIVLLDGEISIETGDGETRTFRGGEVLLVEDIQGRGHKTKQLSPGRRHSLFIPIA